MAAPPPQRPGPPVQAALPRGASADVTVRDIAQAAGVSIGTVSRAMKNQRGLSDETRRHVREVARQLGYDPAQVQKVPQRWPGSPP